MTEQDFLDGIDQGKRVLCVTPEQCIDVLKFLVAHGYHLSAVTVDKFVQRSFIDAWLCPGLSGGVITTWSYKYIQKLDDILTYDDFLSLSMPSVDFVNLADNMAKLFDLEVDEL